MSKNKARSSKFYGAAFAAANDGTRHRLCEGLASSLARGSERAAHKDFSIRACKIVVENMVAQLRALGHELVLWDSEEVGGTWGPLLFYGAMPCPGGVVIHFIFPGRVTVSWLDGRVREVGRVGHREALEGFRRIHPAFEDCWKETFMDCGGRLAASFVWQNFASVIRYALSGVSDIPWRSALRYAEKIMREGEHDLTECVAVYFIEGLLVESDSHPRVMAPALHDLGHECREYALAWNRFQGLRNLGLEDMCGESDRMGRGRKTIKKRKKSRQRK